MIVVAGEGSQLRGVWAWGLRGLRCCRLKKKACWLGKPLQYLVKCKLLFVLRYDRQEYLYIASVESSKIIDKSNKIELCRGVCEW